MASLTGEHLPSVCSILSSVLSTRQRKQGCGCVAQKRCCLCFPLHSSRGKTLCVCFTSMLYFRDYYFIFHVVQLLSLSLNLFVFLCPFLVQVLNPSFQVANYSNYIEPGVFLFYPIFFCLEEYIYQKN